MSNVTRISREIDCLHPEVRTQFVTLSEALISAYETGVTHTLFELFEGYRSPERQQHLFSVAKTTKARPWESAHQYGLAADFVPRNGGKWSWDESHDYKFLMRCAATHGLTVPISWDRVHVQSPLWTQVVLAL